MPPKQTSAEYHNAAIRILFYHAKGVRSSMFPETDMGGYTAADLVSAILQLTAVAALANKSIVEQAHKSIMSIEDPFRIEHPESELN